MTLTLPPARRILGLLASLSPLLLLTLLFWPAAPAQATTDYVVGTGTAASCTMNALGVPMNTLTDASITFNCGGPATISLTQPGGLNVLNGRRFTISGGDIITLTGLDGNRLFWVQTGGALTLTHIVLTHGHDAAQGGAVLNDSAYLALDHVTVSHNSAASSGGAIYDVGGVTRLTNALLLDNRSSDGGAIRSGGALTLTNSALISNSADDIGGALYAAGHVSISGGQLVSNTAANSGGAFYLAATSQTTLNSVLFDHNHTLTATISPLYAGGAIRSGGILTDTGSTYRANASVYGGALDVAGGTANLTNDSLSGNHAYYGGGGLADTGSSPNTTLFHTAMLNNIAEVLGGGLYGEKGIITLHNQSALISNTAQAGGGLYVVAGSNFSIFDSTVSDNHATNENGGGLYLEAGSVGGISGVLLTGNHAEGSGGAIDNESSSFSVLGSTLVNNRAVFGAAIYNAGANFLIGTSIIRGNTAGADGGGLYNTGANLNIGTTTIQGNLAVSGGGIDNAAGASILLYQSTLAGNLAQEGAGVLNVLSATLRLENSTLSGNLALIQGGGLDNAGDVSLLNATLSNNSAPQGGGFNNELGATLAITNTILAYSADGGNCVGLLTHLPRNVSDDNTCGFSGTINSHSPNHLDPLLTGLGNYGGPTPVHMLKHNSPVLDALDGTIALASDQRGVLRPKGGGYDPGAVERVPTESDLAPWLWLPLARR